MGSCIIKLTRGHKVRYLTWSTIVDAPTSDAMTLPELRKYVKQQLGRAGELELPERLERLEKNGGFSMHRDFGAGEGMVGFISGNRAGVDETELTLDELWDMYVEGIKITGSYADDSEMV